MTTSKEAMEIGISELMRHFLPNIVGRECCEWHTGLRAFKAEVLALTKQSGGRCNLKWRRHRDWQCQTCGGLNDDREYLYEDENEKVKICALCSLVEDVDPETNDGSNTKDQPSSSDLNDRAAAASSSGQEASSYLSSRVQL